MSRWLVVAVLAGCASSDAPAPAPPPAPPPVDAAVNELPASGVYDPASGRHLDDDLPPPPVIVRPERPSRAQRPIDLTLRSNPAGAMAAVDGVPLGPTPVYWAGDANGHLHEFTFVSPHYAVARYRFVPVTSGVLFARLEAVTGDEAAGSAAIPVPIPLAVPGLAPPPAPPTVISPSRPASPPPPPPPADAMQPVEPPAPPPVDAAPATGSEAPPAEVDAAAPAPPSTNLGPRE